MVRLFTPSSELDKQIKHYSKFQRMSIRAGIPQTVREKKYYVSVSELNRERTSIARKMKKRQHRFRRSNKHRFEG
jgi:ribosomal protein S21